MTHRLGFSPRLAVGVLVVAVSIAAACTTYLARPVAVVFVRNETRGSVRLEIERPNDFPASLLGPEPVVWWIPPWQRGWCSAASVTLLETGPRDRLPSTTFTVSGTTVLQAEQFNGSPARIEAGGLSLLVDAVGAVDLTSPPSAEAGCADYPAGANP